MLRIGTGVAVVEQPIALMLSSIVWYSALGFTTQQYCSANKCICGTIK